MCGIAGIIATADSIRLEENLREMQRCLRHRGPDDQGIFLSEGGSQTTTASGRSAEVRCGLVHTRLAILDLSAAGHQPMGSGERSGKGKAERETRTVADRERSRVVEGPEKRYWITFNGEIYNFRELRAELQADGEYFQTQTDTEVLLKLYQRAGPECVNRLRGMFAFAIWDELERTCFIARDPFGIKPLYYHAEAGRLVFASELRAVFASNLVPRRLNPAGVFGYFCTGSVPEPETMLQDVLCLEAGHWLLWREGRLQKECYWSLHFDSDPIPEDLASHVRNELLDTVRHHFVSDVPVGIFLSGGIDSTALVALAGLAGYPKVRTFSLGFAEAEFDESRLARTTAKGFGTEHAEWRMDSATGRGLFQEFLERLDQPSIDGFNSYCICKFAHDQGMKVVLSGLGGDELFGGYPSFRQIPRLVQASRRLAAVAPVRRTLGSLLESYSPSPRWRRVGHFLGNEPGTRAGYEAFRGVFVPEDAQTLTLRYCCSRANIQPEPAPTPMATCGDEVSDLEFRRYMRNQLLRDSDAMSMAWGLELRVPLVDRKLVATLARLPASVRLASGKRLLLNAVPEIPMNIAQAPKRGFRFPFDEWLKADWGEMFERETQVKGIRVQTWYQKWSVFVLNRWCKTMGVN